MAHRSAGPRQTSGSRRTPRWLGVVGVVLLACSAGLPAPAEFGRPVERHPDVPAPTNVISTASVVSSDIVVFGGTPAGIMAAVAAARAGALVVLIEPASAIGGMMSNGLGWTDKGDAGVIGGLAAEFFDRSEAIEGSAGGRWGFHPSTADRVFGDMLSEAGVDVILNGRLAGTTGVGVTMAGSRIDRITLTSGAIHRADVFVDATYEGDLMARTGVSYRIGRESQADHNEYRAGVRRVADVMHVPAGMDPGFPTSEPAGPAGTGDNRIQNSNYRLCVSSDPGNRVPFAKPPGYDAARYEIVLRYISERAALGETPQLSWLVQMESLGGHKWDFNETSRISMGLPGANYDYPDGTYTRRAEIAALHRSYQKGFLYFVSTDPRVAAGIRNAMAGFGLCADEFTDNGNWPRMLYLREGRRMEGQYFLTQRDVEALVSKPDTIGLASYRLDSHVVSRWIDEDGNLLLEGGLGAANAQRWSIPYRSLTPLLDEAENLLVAVTVSASHVAQSSLRMEPQYMIMGQAAGAAAAIAQGRYAVQDVPIATLQSALRRAGAVLDDPGDAADSFYEAIAWAYREEITHGCAPTLFCPDQHLRRGEMASLLARALDLPPATRDHFTDDAGSTHENSINRVAEAGITFGCATKRYCPNATVTRAQLASFFARAFSLPASDRDYFSDDAGSTHEDSINRIAASGITAGCTETRFCPENAVTRGQTFAFLFRHYDGGPPG